MLLIILGQPLPNLSYGAAHDVVGRGVIVGRALEDVNADGPFLELVTVPFQGPIDDILQNGSVAFAVMEDGAFEDLLELLAHLLALQV